MRALTCPKAPESPKRSMIRLASATSRRSALSAPRSALALLTRKLRMTSQDEQRFGGDRVQPVHEASGSHAVPFFASGRLWRKPRSKCPRSEEHTSELQSRQYLV